MHALIATTFILALAASAPASALSQQQTAPARTDPALSTLTGCVSAKPDPAGNFTFTQTESGSRFRLIGKAMREWAGKPVEIVSAKGKGISVRGGLLPSPNVAAQAGHIDSAQAALASQPGVANAGKGDEALPEFRVNQVRPFKGACS